MKKKKEILIHSVIRLDVSDKLYNKLKGFSKEELEIWICTNSFRTNARTIFEGRLEEWNHSFEWKRRWSEVKEVA